MGLIDRSLIWTNGIQYTQTNHWNIMINQMGLHPNGIHDEQTSEEIGKHECWTTSRGSVELGELVALGSLQGVVLNHEWYPTQAMSQAEITQSEHDSHQMLLVYCDCRNILTQLD